MRRYLLGLISIPIIAFVAGSTLVWLANPYWMWSVPPSVAIVDPARPRNLPNQRRAKAWHITNHQPNGLILGASRSEFGLDPEHPGWSAHNVYNASLGGGPIYEVLRYFQHAIYVGQIDQVVLNLELFMFAPETPNTTGSFDERNFCVPASLPQPKGIACRRILRWSPMASIDGWIDAISLLTTPAGASPTSTLFLPNGQREQSYYWDVKIQPRGQRWAFERTAVEMTESQRGVFTEKRLCDESIEYYRQILELAYTHEIDLHIVLSPVHIWLLEIYYQNGDWPLLEEWKRVAVETNESVAADYDIAPAPVWDFIEYNTFTAEEIPPTGDRATSMQWFWEISHYRPALGDLILDRVFGTETESLPGSVTRSIAEKENFGTLITPDNIDARNHEVRFQRGYYLDRLATELAFLYE